MLNDFQFIIYLELKLPVKVLMFLVKLGSRFGKPLIFRYYYYSIEKKSMIILIITVSILAVTLL